LHFNWKKFGSYIQYPYLCKKRKWI
jgi:hypothetical protein